MESKFSINLDSSYCGKIKVESWLLINKWHATIGLIFGKYVKRYFALDLLSWTFSYFLDDHTSKPNHQYSLQDIVSVEEVTLTGNIASEYRYGFLVITSERPYHLFALSMEDKLMFMYAFSALLHVKKRPNKTFYEKELLSNYPGHYFLPKYIHKTEKKCSDHKKEEYTKSVLPEISMEFVEAFSNPVKNENPPKPEKKVEEKTDTNSKKKENLTKLTKQELARKFIRNHSPLKVRIVSEKEAKPIPVQQVEEVPIERINCRSQRPITLRRHSRATEKPENNSSLDYASPFCISFSEPERPETVSSLPKAEETKKIENDFEKMLREAVSQFSCKPPSGRQITFRRRLCSFIPKPKPIKQEKESTPPKFEEEWNFDTQISLPPKPVPASGTSTNTSSEYIRKVKCKAKQAIESNKDQDFDYSW